MVFMMFSTFVREGQKHENRHHAEAHYEEDEAANARAGTTPIRLDVVLQFASTRRAARPNLHAMFDLN